MSEIEMSIHDNLFDWISFKDSKIKACMINLLPPDEEIIEYFKTQPDGLVYLTMIADKHWKAMTYSYLQEKKCVNGIELSEIYELGITTLYLNLYQERYHGGDLKSYFIGICKNIWFNKLRYETGELVLKEGMPILLDIYRRLNIKSTFYFTGYMAEHFPDVVRMIVAEGHGQGHWGGLEHKHIPSLRLPKTIDELVHQDAVVPVKRGQH